MIDGYNVIKRHPAWKRLTPFEGRRRLIQHVQTLHWPLHVTRAVAVFDAPSGSSQPITASLRICFAPSADAWIQDTIRACRTPERLLIVSDDREILDTAKSHGARCCPSTWLIERRSTSAPEPRRDTPSTKNLPASEARRITEELEQRWLGS